MTKKAQTTSYRRFRVGPEGAYRDGVLYPQGSFIDLPDDGDPKNAPSRTFVEVDAKADDNTDEEGNPLPAGAEGIQERAKNPNPLPPTPASSKSFQAQGQYIAKGEDEETVGEKMDTEKRKKGGTPAPSGVVRAVHATTEAAKKAEEAATGEKNKSPY